MALIKPYRIVGGSNADPNKIYMDVSAPSLGQSGQASYEIPNLEALKQLGYSDTDVEQRYNQPLINFQGALSNPADVAKLYSGKTVTIGGKYYDVGAGGQITPYQQTPEQTAQMQSAGLTGAYRPGGALSENVLGNLGQWLLGGQSLTPGTTQIPLAPVPTATPYMQATQQGQAAGQTPEAIAQQYAAKVNPQPVQPTAQPLAANAGTTQTQQPATQANQTYTVKAGDTLSAIAQRLGVNVNQITGYKSGNPNLIQPGEVLTIGGGQTNVSGNPLDIKAQMLSIDQKITNLQNQLGQAQAGGYTSGEQIQYDANGNVIPKNTMPTGGDGGAGGGTTGAGTAGELIIPTSDTLKGKTQAEIDADLNKFAADAAAAGLPADFVAKYVQSLYSPAKTKVELQEEIYTKYGISDLEAKFTAQPAQTFEDIYKSALKDLGIDTLQTQINDVTAKIAQADADYAKATGTINENPWLSEAGRVGKIEKLNINYTNTKNGLTNQLTLLTNSLDRGKQSAENVATRAITQFAQEKQWTAEELKYYLDRANADVQAEMGLQTQAQEAMGYRYFPEYAKAFGKATEPTAQTAPKTMETAQGIMQWNEKTGQWESTGYSPYEKPSAGTGELTPYQKFTSAQSLQNNLIKWTKGGQEVVRNYSLMKEALDRYNRGEATDLNATSQAIIMAFNKISDPSSVVRESEYARSPEGVGLLQRLEGTVTRLQQGGAGLTPKALAEFVSLAKTFSDNAQASLNAEVARTKAMAVQFGIDPSLIGGYGTYTTPVDPIKDLTDTIEQNRATYSVEGGREKLIAELVKAFPELTQKQIEDKVYSYGDKYFIK